MRKVALLVPMLALAAGAADFRLGIVGTDTSHSTVFTQAFNDTAAPNHVPGLRVVAAYKGGSQDIESSRKRVDQYAEELRTKWNVEIVPDIATLCSKVDGILLESVDGRVHLEQAKQVFASRKPVFIDKPLASTLEDAREIARLAKEAGVPWFTSSSLRFGGTAEALKSPANTGVATWGPGPLEEHHQLDLTWYGIHAVELLYTLMGTGCEEVTRVTTPDADVTVGRWKGGRIGSVRTLRPYSDFGAVAFRAKEIVQSSPKDKNDYSGLLREIAQFFQTGKPPVAVEETLEMFSFMDAAQRSKAAGGAPMRLR
ncbi:MAG TPA: Gfo/Idh/MocA family oxidoreductase [Bryobacteraceae bacterium]|nr:Gfo/Idh/MocA family oxidoreductase [Bryobacteraceae bacterium]